MQLPDDGLKRRRTVAKLAASLHGWRRSLISSRRLSLVTGRTSRSSRLRFFLCLFKVPDLALGTK